MAKPRSKVKHDETQDEMVARLKAWALVDITDVVEIVTVKKTDAAGVEVDALEVVVMPTKQIPKEVRACIKSIRKTRHGVEVKFHDAMEAMDLLMKHYGMYREGATVGAIIFEPTYYCAAPGPHPIQIEAKRVTGQPDPAPQIVEEVKKPTHMPPAVATPIDLDAYQKWATKVDLETEQRLQIIETTKDDGF